MRWFPVGGFGESFGDNLYHLFLPALTLALSLSAVLMRNLRSSIIDVLDAEYVDFARAKGLRNRVVLGRHVLRNALISTVALFGLNIGTLFAACLKEKVFAIHVRSLMIDSSTAETIRESRLDLGSPSWSPGFLVTDMVQAWSSAVRHS